MLFRLCFLLIFPILLSAEDPWEPSTPSSTSSPSLLPKILIHFHQQVLSPADGPRSHFTPSSSEYAKQSFARYGLLKGYLMTCDRLMRENSEVWVYPVILYDGYALKWDPVE